MAWQDIVFGLGSLIFIVALVPMVFDESTPPLRTSVTTGLVLLAFGITYATMGYIFAACTSLITATLWLTLAIQRVKIQAG